MTKVQELFSRIDNAEDDLYLSYSEVELLREVISSVV